MPQALVVTLSFTDVRCQCDEWQCLFSEHLRTSMAFVADVQLSICMPACIGHIGHKSRHNYEAQS